ncbi:MAG: HAMP domain-containing sensor histidine kinase [Campylobacterota bacterium]|nr:HAMP domain-containing sensor histidine kinase [Campylobacterota bacterium]
MNFFRQMLEPNYDFRSDEWILKYKVRILINISFTLGLLLIVFTLFRVIKGDFQLAMVDGFFALYLVVSGYYLRRDKYNYNLVSKLFLVFGLAVIFLNFHLAEETFIRVLWFSSYIVLVFFLRDKKEGFIWLGILFFLISIVAYFEDHLNLNMVNYITFIVSLLLTGVVLYWYEKLKEGDSERLKVMNESLQEKIDIAVLDNQKQERLMIEQAKMAAMGEMIESIAHQWRQPLNVLGLSIAKVEMEHEMGMKDSRNIHETYAEMGRQITYMSQTIDDFRSFYKRDKELQNVKLVTLFHEAEGLVSSLLNAKNITVRSEIDETITLNVYANELKQVLLNMITNAKDAFLERDIKIPMINIRAYHHNHGVMIEVLDNAGGIDETIIQKIFEPYFTTKFASKGTGIGLYMSKVIIEEHMDGNLSVENSRNGALFKIFLPQLDL